MIAAPIPPADDIRLAALESTGLMGTPDEYILDRITHIGANLFSLPICLLTLVDAGRQWFKSCVGLDQRETSRDISFCGHVVACGEPVVVEDALLDLRFADNPLVIGEPYIRFYAGHPIRDASREVLGTLCVAGYQPLAFSEERRTLLRELAELAELSLSMRHVSSAQKELVANLEVARRESLLDPMLRIWNRRGLDALLERQKAGAVANGAPFSVLMIDVDHFKKINDNYGHSVGDAVLKAVVEVLRRTLRSGDEICRYGGDEFLVILPNATAARSAFLAQRINDAVATLRVDTAFRAKGCLVRIGCTVSIGIAEWISGSEVTGDTLVDRADAALLCAKRLGRNRALSGRPAASAPVLLQAELEN